MARKNASGTVPCPFKILIDSNEAQVNHDAFTFEGILSNKDTGELPFEVVTEVKHLANLGDYQIGIDHLAPFEQPKCVVERKSAADLFGSITKRDNMEWRLNLMDTEAEHAVMMIESSLDHMQQNPPSHYAAGGKLVQTGQTFRSVHATILSWQMRFRRVHWYFAPSRDWAELATFWIFYRFHDNLSHHKLDRDRKRKNYRAYLEGLQAHRKRKKITESPYRKEHAHGDLADYWARGWLDHERVARDQIADPHELPLVEDDAFKK